MARGGGAVTPLLLLAFATAIFCIAVYKLVGWINSRQKRDQREVD